MQKIKWKRTVIWKNSFCRISSIGQRIGRTNEMEIQRAESKWSEPLNSQTSIDTLGETNAVGTLYLLKKEKRREREKLENNDKRIAMTDID